MNVHRTVFRVPADTGQSRPRLRSAPAYLSLVRQYWEQIGVATALAVAFVVRARYLFAGTFPLNDGGLFYVMTRELQQAGFRLPATTTYNHLHIPFAYPPLAFYVAGLVSSVLHIDLLTVFRFLPVLVDMACLGAFYILARSLLDSKAGAIVALSIFGLLPAAFIVFIMGGGMTRSFGFCFAILAVHRLHLMYRGRRMRDAALATLLCSLTLLSHIETAYFLAITALLLLIWFGRTRRGLAETAAVGTGTLLLTAPWWLAVVHTHGLRPFLEAAQTGGGFLPGLAMLIQFSVTQEALFPVLGALALLGALVCWRRSRSFLVYWLVAIVLLDSRAAGNYATVPLALLASIGITEVILPFLGGRLQTPSTAYHEQLGGPAAHVPWERLSPALLLLGAVCLYSLMSSISTARQTLGSLTVGDRQAMQWIAASTPPASRFVVITGLGTPASAAGHIGQDQVASWGVDRWSEWFPALTDRPSIATVQGYEWLGNTVGREFSYFALQDCATRDADCLARWSAGNGGRFDYVYIARATAATDSFVHPEGCCERLRQSLLADTGYRLVYDSAAASVFARADAPS